jgi:hypothetical protein
LENYFFNRYLKNKDIIYIHLASYKFKDTKGYSEAVIGKTDNAMAKRQKDRQRNGQKTERQTTQWPKDRKTDNAMAKREKDRQRNGQKTERQTTQWPKEKGRKDKQ